MTRRETGGGRTLLALLGAVLLSSSQVAGQGYGSSTSSPGGSSSLGGRSSSFSSSSGGSFGSGSSVTVAPATQAAPSFSTGGGVQAPSFASGSSGKTLEAAFPTRPTLKAPDFFGNTAASPAAKPGEAPRPTVAAQTALRASAMQRLRLRQVLDGLVGAPFAPGGRDPAGGLDGAGLVWHVYKSIQRSVSDDVEDQQRIGQRFGSDQFLERGRLRDDARLAVGDILFFRVGMPHQGSTGYRPVIYYGDGLGVYPSQSKGRVVVEDIRDRARALAFVQRVLQ